MATHTVPSDIEQTERRALLALEHIEHNTRPSWLAAIGDGLLRGAAFTIGSVFIIAVLGWILSIVGVIPGIGELARQLQHFLNR